MKVGEVKNKSGKSGVGKSGVDWARLSCVTGHCASFPKEKLAESGKLWG